MNGDVGPARRAGRAWRSAPPEHNRPPAPAIRPAARPRGPASSSRADRLQAVGSARQRQLRLPVPHRRIQGGVLRCRKIGGIRDQRVEAAGAQRRRTDRRARASTRRADVSAGSRSASASASGDRSIADDLRRSRPRSRGSGRCSPLPVPTSATRPVRTRARTRSTSPSVSGRGISARRSHRSVRWRKPAQPGHVGERLARGAAADRPAANAAAALSATAGSASSSAAADPSPGELGPEAERLAARRADARRRERRRRVGDQRAPARDASLRHASCSCRLAMRSASTSVVEIAVDARRPGCAPRG